MDQGRFERAVAAIDAANADDPHHKELRHAQLATKWVQRLRPDASEALLLAARAHHLRRWTIPRTDYPEGRNGYLRWRRELQKQHAADVGRILDEQGYDGTTIERVQQIVQKRRLSSDLEVQTFEDALCLVFLETQLTEFVERHSDKADDVLAKTMEKMSAEGKALASALLSGSAGSPPGAPSR